MEQPRDTGTTVTEFMEKDIPMEIKVLGSGCSKCHSTIGIIERAAQASGVEVEIVKVENPDEINRAGVKA